MNRRFELGSFTAALCLAAAFAPSAWGDDWPQWLGPERNSVWAETGIVREFGGEGPPIKWRVPIAGGYAGPAVAQGRVIVTDYQVDQGDAVANPSMRPELHGRERVLCLDAETGSELWKHEYECTYKISYPAGPRVTPTIDGDRVYTLGAEGHLKCLALDDGRVIWERDLKADYKMAEAPFWGFSGHPLVAGDLLYCLVGGEGSVAVALDKMTGEERWRALTAESPGYCPPSMIEAGGQQQLLIWHPESVNSLDPATGKVFWSLPLKPAYGMSIVAPSKSGDKLFVGAIQNESLLVRLSDTSPTAEEVWRGKGIFPVHSPVFMEGDYLYGVHRDGTLCCVDLNTGERVWETTEPTTGARPLNSGTAFLVKNQDCFFIFNERGELVIAKLSPQGCEIVSRAKLVEPTGDAFNRKVVWSHPAFANRCIFVRNDAEIVCASLAEDDK
jgi:outer membrane protein assembly factor BamB